MLSVDRRRRRWLVWTALIVAFVCLDYALSFQGTTGPPHPRRTGPKDRVTVIVPMPP